MRWLLFLSRVAFICNLLFVVTISFRFYNWVGSEELKSLIIIIGFVLAILFNPVTVLTTLFLFILNRKKLDIIPAWLIVANAVFLFVQLLYIFALNIESQP